MALRTDIIPTTILKAAKRAGLSKPDWYVGRINGHEAHEREVTLESIVQEVTDEATDPVRRDQRPSRG